MMSFAKRPEAMTEEWIRRLSEGVGEDELHALFVAAGLPATTARDVVASGSERTDPRTAANPFTSGFRRATIGTVVLLTLVGIAALIGTRGVTYNVVGLAIGFALCGVVLIKAIGRISREIG